MTLFDKIFLIFIIALFLFIVIAITIDCTMQKTDILTETDNKITITWDAPTEYTNGNPIPEDMIITYEVYIRKTIDKIAIFIAMVKCPPYDLIFPDRGCYDVGVLAVCDNQKSAMNWS